jgi:hypothetical protein
MEELGYPKGRDLRSAGAWGHPGKGQSEWGGLEDMEDMVASRFPSVGGG